MTAREPEVPLVAKAVKSGGVWWCAQYAFTTEYGIYAYIQQYWPPENGRAGYWDRSTETIDIRVLDIRLRKGMGRHFPNRPRERQRLEQP